MSDWQPKANQVPNGPVKAERRWGQRHPQKQSWAMLAAHRLPASAGLECSDHSSIILMLWAGVVTLSLLAHSELVPGPGLSWRRGAGDVMSVLWLCNLCMSAPF